MTWEVTQLSELLSTSGLSKRYGSKYALKDADILSPEEKYMA